MADLFAVAFDPNKKEIRTSKTEGGGGARSLKGAEIPRDLAPGRAKSLAISPGRWGQIPATPEQIVCYIIDFKNSGFIMTSFHCSNIK